MQAGAQSRYAQSFDIVGTCILLLRKMSAVRHELPLGGVVRVAALAAFASAADEVLAPPVIASLERAATALAQAAIAAMPGTIGLAVHRFISCNGRGFCDASHFRVIVFACILFAARLVCPLRFNFNHIR